MAKGKLTGTRGKQQAAGKLGYQKFQEQIKRSVGKQDEREHPLIGNLPSSSKDKVPLIPGNVIPTPLASNPMVFNPSAPMRGEPLHKSTSTHEYVAVPSRGNQGQERLIGTTTIPYEQLSAGNLRNGVFQGQPVTLHHVPEEGIIYDKGEGWGPQIPNEPRRLPFDQVKYLLEDSRPNVFNDPEIDDINIDFKNRLQLLIEVIKSLGYTGIDIELDPDTGLNPSAAIPPTGASVQGPLPRELSGPPTAVAEETPIEQAGEIRREQIAQTMLPTIRNQVDRLKQIAKDITGFSRKPRRGGKPINFKEMRRIDKELKDLLKEIRANHCNELAYVEYLRMQNNKEDRELLINIRYGPRVVVPPKRGYPCMPTSDPFKQ